jgi:predicted nucleic-acid-binding Zn-ribbon protein
MIKYRPDQPCPKCGNTGTDDQYVASSGSVTLKASVIRRQCRNCKYQWSELPLDAAEQE